MTHRCIASSSGRSSLQSIISLSERIGKFGSCRSSTVEHGRQIVGIGHEFGDRRFDRRHASRVVLLVANDFEQQIEYLVLGRRCLRIAAGLRFVSRFDRCDLPPTKPTQLSVKRSVQSCLTFIGHQGRELSRQRIERILLRRAQICPLDDYSTIRFQVVQKQADEFGNL